LRSRQVGFGWEITEILAPVRVTASQCITEGDRRYFFIDFLRALFFTSKCGSKIIKIGIVIEESTESPMLHIFKDPNKFEN